MNVALEGWACNMDEIEAVDKPWKYPKELVKSENYP